MYEQVLDPVGGSLFASAPFAALPQITLFVLLGGLKLLLLAMCVLVLLQSLVILSWMVV